MTDNDIVVMDHLHFTPMGTLVRQVWTKKYYQQVLRVERITKHRICGSPTRHFTPCRSYPKEDYGYYCKVHRPSSEDGVDNPEEAIPVTTPNKVEYGLGNSQDVSLSNYEKEKGIFQKPLMVERHLRRNFSQCNICPVRTECVQMQIDKHCTIEEDMFNTFLDAARHDYDLQDFTKVDMYMLYTAAFAWINSVRANIIQNLYSPTNDEVVRIQIESVRESREFRQTMEKLGLTRQERMKMRRKDYQIGISAKKAQANISLANQMADAKRMQSAGTKDVENV